MFGLGLEVSDDNPARTRDPKTQGRVERWRVTFSPRRGGRPRSRMGHLRPYDE